MKEEEILEAYNYSSNQFDKLIVSLSSGALVLSIGFVKDLVNICECTPKGWLITSWSCFSLALISILLSHKSAIYLWLYKYQKVKTKENTSRNLTKIFNGASLLFLFGGIIIFIIFISNNF